MYNLVVVLIRQAIVRKIYIQLNRRKIFSSNRKKGKCRTRFTFRLRLLIFLYRVKLLSLSSFEKIPNSLRNLRFSRFLLFLCVHLSGVKLSIDESTKILVSDPCLNPVKRRDKNNRSRHPRIVSFRRLPRSREQLFSRLYFLFFFSFYDHLISFLSRDFLSFDSDASRPVTLRAVFPSVSMVSSFPRHTTHDSREIKHAYKIIVSFRNVKWSDQINDYFEFKGYQEREQRNRKEKLHRVVLKHERARNTCTFETPTKKKKMVSEKMRLHFHRVN